MSDTPGAQRVDRVIDEVLARRSAARPGRRGDGPAPSPLTADEDLVAELAGLGVIDWPADETGERIARSTAKLAGQPAADAAERSSHRQRGRPGRRARWVAAGTAAVAAALLAAAGQFGPWLHATTSRGAKAPATSPGQAVTSPSRYGQPVMRLVDSPTSPFQRVGAGNNLSVFFTCVTASVCYTDKQVKSGDVVERTSDGGATWRHGAGLPAGLGFGDTISCPTTQMCAGVVGRLQIAIITDGGARLRIEHLTAPPGIPRPSLTTVSCATATTCVAGVDGATASTFLRTRDGGKSWTAASSVPAAISRNRTNMGALQCGPDGSCIGLAFVGPNGIDQAAVHTADGGRTWTISPLIPTPRGASILQMTCGDGRHCMMLSDNGVMVMITAAADGHVSSQEQAFPRSWPHVGIEVSCATGRDCFVSAQGTGAAIEATHDGGRTWTAISLPTVNGDQIAIVYPISCPSPAGCIAVAATSSQFTSGSKRVIISNLPPVR